MRPGGLRIDLAGRGVQLELAQIDGAVALRIGGVEGAGGGHLAGYACAGGTQVRPSADRQGVASPSDHVAVPCRSAACRGQTLKGRLADHIQHRVERNIFELRLNLAVDGNECGGG